MGRTKLSVNINKIATLRNARGGDDPSVLEAAKRIQNFGADGITVHPRPDERHIRRSDVYALKPWISTEFNIEGYPSEDFLSLVQDIKPEQVTLVPDPPNVLTSNAGWNVQAQRQLLEHSCKSLQGSRISVFVDPTTCSEVDLKSLKDLGVQRIELYTEAYAKAFKNPSLRLATLDTYVRLAELVLKQGLEINAGHDLNQINLGLFIDKVPEVREVSIGHALISEALYEGMEYTVKSYLKILTKT